MKKKYVFDANVLISAFLLRKSRPAQALELAQKIGTILLSDEVSTEVEEVLDRPKFDRYLNLTKRQTVLEELLENSLFIEPTKAIDECRDPKDNKYLELAVAGKAEWGASQFCKKAFFAIPNSQFPIPKKRQILGFLQN